MSYKKISYEVNDKVAYIGFGYNCKNSMTTLGEEALSELQSIAESLTKDQKNLKAAVFHSHKDRCFLAGADINLIAAMRSEADGSKGAEAGQNIYNIIVNKAPFSVF